MGRFVVAEHQNLGSDTNQDVVEILVDTKTGINYLWRTQGNAGGLTPLLRPDFRPVKSSD